MHIPKTAGTNFTRQLELFFGTRIYKDYGTERDLVAARTCAPEILREPIAFMRRYDVIHGHYHYLKYKGVFPEIETLATLRHPVSRVVSQYRHIALHGDRNVERHRLIMDGKMDLLHFSRFRFIGNAQSIFLEGLQIDDLDHAIIQEHMPQTVKRFCEAFNLDFGNEEVQSLISKPINSREKSDWDCDAIPVDPEVFPRVEKNCEQDLELYKRATEKFLA